MQEKGTSVEFIKLNFFGRKLNLIAKPLALMYSTFISAFNLKH